MADEEFTDINGNWISLDCQTHSSFCREFTVTSPKLSLRKVMVYTCCVWLFAYAVFFFTQNTAVLSSAIILTLVGMVIHIHFVKVDHETLLIIGSLGVQLSSSYASGRESTTFIEMSKLKDIVINEAVYMHNIIYYLCILIKDPADPETVTSVVPLFQSSKPRLNCLIQVYKSCQEILAQSRWRRAEAFFEDEWRLENSRTNHKHIVGSFFVLSVIHNAFCYMQKFLDRLRIQKRLYITVF